MVVAGDLVDAAVDVVVVGDIFDADVVVTVVVAVDVVTVYVIAGNLVVIPFYSCCWCRESVLILLLLLLEAVSGCFLL